MFSFRKDRPGTPARTAFLLAMIGSFSLAQQADFRVTVNQVMVYVSVTNKQGKPLRGLMRENFQVYENGVLQQVDSFEEISWDGESPPLDKASADSLQPAVEGSPLSPRQLAVRRFLILRFDPMLGPRELKRAKRIGRRFVEKLEAGPDRLAVSWRNVLSEFTQDRERLTGLIEDIQPTLQALARELDQGSLAPLQRDASGGSQSPGNSPAAADDLSRLFSNTDQLDLFGDQITYDMARGSFLDGSDLISRLKNLEGRKLLIYIGEGLPTVDPSNSNAFDTRQLSAYDPGYNARLYNDAGFTVYAISSRGLRADEVTAAWGNQFRDPRRGASASMVRNYSNTGLENIFLRRWTQNTGGIAFYNSNSIPRAVNTVLKHASHSYFLAYRSKNPALDNRYRRIEVRVKSDKKAALRVRYRRGYFATVPSPAELQRRSLLTAMLQPDGFDDFPLQVEARLSRGPEQAVEFSLSFPFEKIAILDYQIPGKKKNRPISRHFQEIDVVVAAFSGSGQYLGSQQEKFVLDFDSEQLAGMRTGKATLQRRIELQQGLPEAAFVKTVVIVGQNRQISARMTPVGR